MNNHRMHDIPKNITVDKGSIDLRDHFAATALNGILSATYSSLRSNPDPERHLKIVARISYEIADYMLAARNR